MHVISTPDLDTATLLDAPPPSAGPGELLIRVACSAINPADFKVIGGEFAGRILHARTRPLVVGYDVSGTVEAVGADVTDLAVGDRVWGHLPYASSNRQGAFAELVTLRREEVAALPDAVPHHVAAAAATVGLTALQSLRDLAGVGPGKRVLVIGAAGGVGSLAVGVGKRLGAEVVGVCSARDLGRVRALGADEAIDRAGPDPFAGDARYDLVFDTPAVSSYGACARALRPGGAYVTTLPTLGFILGKVRTLLSSRRCAMIVVNSRRADLELLGAWLADGLEVPIASRHPVRDLQAALAAGREGGRGGRIVVDVEGGWAA